MERFGLVVDLQPWPAPVGALDVARLGDPLRDTFKTVRVWHPLDPEDEAGRMAGADPRLAAVVLSGSLAMVGDGAPWMDALAEAVDLWAARRVPLLGTCFGHQFLAHHFGGRIGSFPTRRIARAPLHVVDPHDPLVGEVPADAAFVWTHRDLVLEVPPVLHVTATSAEVPVEAFRHRTLPIWGLQAHPEVDRDLAQAIVRIDPEAAPALRRHPWSAYDGGEGRRILMRFAQLAAATPRPREG